MDFEVWLEEKQMRNAFKMAATTVLTICVGSYVLSRIAYELLPKKVSEWRLTDFIMFVSSPLWWYWRINGQ